MIIFSNISSIRLSDNKTYKNQIPKTGATNFKSDKYIAGEVVDGTKRFMLLISIISVNIWYNEF